MGRGAALIAPAVDLLRECRSEAFADASVAELEKLVVSLKNRDEVRDRELAALVVGHRLVRTRLERHRQLCQGVL